MRSQPASSPRGLDVYQVWFHSLWAAAAAAAASSDSKKVHPWAQSHCRNAMYVAAMVVAPLVRLLHRAERGPVHESTGVNDPCVLVAYTRAGQGQEAHVAFTCRVSAGA